MRRSTKAGPAGPATLGVDPLIPDRRIVRSTKAGPAGPATLVIARVLSGWVVCAQRRPALPGRQLQTVPRKVLDLLRRSTKAGPAGPATPCPRRCRRSPHTPLNEGWPCRAGNSRAGRGRWCTRRGRSTKAGPAGPATPAMPRDGQGTSQPAQRRPDLPGRQLPALYSLFEAGCRRAQRRPALPGRQLTTTMESKGWGLVDAQRRLALPGRQLGDGDAVARPARRRSTKASPAGPARPHPKRRFAQRRPALPGRQLLSREFVPAPKWYAAQRRLALPGRQLPCPAINLPPALQRSTKAGPAGPATLVGGCLLPGRAPSLNEGRPCRAGNSPISRPGRRGRSPLNEGRPCRAGNSLLRLSCP